MAEYIEREAVLSKLQANKSLFLDAWGGFDKLPPRDKAAVDELDNCISEILNTPAADVACVVRCRECAYKAKAKVNEKGFLICPASGMEICDDDFCSYGERRTENDL